MMRRRVLASIQVIEVGADLFELRGVIRDGV